VDEPGYYLPHPVLKDTSLTTKLHVVFYASCKISMGVSLNDVLMVAHGVATRSSVHHLEISNLAICHDSGHRKNVQTNNSRRIAKTVSTYPVARRRSSEYFLFSIFISLTPLLMEHLRLHIWLREHYSRSHI